jgi:apolipoprotein N-acyltransferase
VNPLAKALRLWPWLAAISTGVAYRLCFAPFDQPWLCWIALTPLLTAIWFSGAESKRRWLRDLSLGYIAGVTFFWSVFSWLITVTGMGWILVGAYMACYFAIWSWLCGCLRPKPRIARPLAGLEAVTQRLEAKRAAERGEPVLPNEPAPAVSPWLSSYRNLLLAFLLAAAWVATESVRASLFSGWGWNTLGTALHAQWAMIQIAEFTGIPGLSFLVAFTNIVLVATVRRFIEETQVRQRRPHFEFTLTMAAIVGVIGYGVRAIQLPQPFTNVRVAMLQPNVPREHKFNEEFARATFNHFRTLSEIALRTKPDLLLWPESSMPHAVIPGTESYDFIRNFVRETKVDLLTGIIDEDEKEAYNAAFFVAADGERTQRYRKLHLVPFGEYVPGRNTIPGIARIVGDQVPEDFGFGTEYTVFQLTRPEVRAAPLICFEDTIGELTRQFVLRGANLLANVTNDGWFRESAGSQQHLDNAVFRCVETRLPMVRSANTGVTCFVNEFGRVTHRWPSFTEGVLTGEVRVPVEYEPTFYVRHGELFAKGCAAITGLLVLALLLQLVRRRSAAATV